jgi:hypothetical protein
VPCEVCVNQTAVFRAGQAGAQNLRALFAAGLDRLLELNVKRWRCVMCQPEKASNVNSYTYTHSDCGKPADSCTMPFASALIRLCLAAPASASLSQICNPIYNEQMSHLPDCPNRARVSGQANVRKGRDFLGHLVQIRMWRAWAWGVLSASTDGGGRAYVLGFQCHRILCPGPGERAHRDGGQDDEEADEGGEVPQ